MTDPTHCERWATPEFRHELTAWVQAELGPVRMEQQKLRPWSTVWKAYAGPVGEELFWAKQNCPENLFEAELAAVLGGVLPEHFVPVRAVDPVRGLLLTPDQGEPLGLMRGDLATWTRIVRDWGVVQRALVDRDVPLPGVPVLGPQDIEPLVVERISALTAIGEDDPRHLDAETAQALRLVLPELRRSVDAVAEVGLPLALNHNDLHGGNVFDVPGEGLRFFDLGDVVLGDPMGVLMVPLQVMTLVGWANDDPRLWRVAEAWVEIWSDLASPTALRRALPHAMRLAQVTRHEAWMRATAGLLAGDLDQWAPQGAESLAALLTLQLLADGR